MLEMWLIRNWAIRRQKRLDIFQISVTLWLKSDGKSDEYLSNTVL